MQIRTGFLLCSLAGLSWAAAPAHAVVINSSNPAAFSNTPAGLTNAWNSIGNTGVGSAVYLGNRWAITVSHIGTPAALTLASGQYPTDLSTIVQMVDPETNQPTDMVLFRLQTDPGLPDIPIANTTPTLNQSVTIISGGQIQSSGTPVFYSATGDPLTWTQLPNSSGANAAGYLQSSTIAKRWGRNALGLDPFTQTLQSTGNLPAGTARLITTYFDNLSQEGQPVDGDSGGGLFDTASGRLVGLIGAKLVFQNQPGNAAILGNAAVYLDISKYEPQITRVIGRTAVVPEPATLTLAAAPLLALARRRRR